MLDFSWSHILIVLIVALVVVGPKDLPRLMRIVGQWTGKARALAGQCAGVPGGLEVWVLGSEVVEHLTVVMGGFDEKGVVQLLGGEA